MGRVAAPHIITDDSALGGAVIERSLRFNDDDSAYLSRTPSSAGNRRTYTISVWAKIIDNNNYRAIIGAGGGSNRDRLQIFNDDKIVFNLNDGSDAYLRTNRVVRDPSAWYHLVVGVDTTQGTASNRIKLYVNGVQETSFTNETYPSQNYDCRLNNNIETYIGNSSANNLYFEGYLAEFNFIDGSQLTPSSFGYTESQTGLWRPKRYEGAYGTNGFHLEFKNNSSTSALGTDTSGNGNNFTLNNFAVSDSMPDTPTNNFATYDPLAESGGSYSEGNLKVVSTADPASSTIGFTSGKFYFEVYVDATNNMYIGVIPIDFGLNPGRGGGWNHGAIAYKANGDQYSLKAGQSSVSASYGASYTAGDIIGCAVDIDNDTITFYKNGVSQGNTTNGVSYISPTGAKDQTYGSIIYCNGGNNIMRANFGQDSTFQGTVSAGGNKDASGLGDFKYAVPSGYNALCSKNLPLNVSSIIKPQKHFDTLTYTGNAGTDHDITGLEFQPDLVWIKSRSQGSSNHGIVDSVRLDSGSHPMLYPNLTNAETGGGNYFTLTTSSGRDPFLPDGFILNNNSSGNNNGSTYVAWCWKAGGGTSSSNPFMIDGKPYATAAAAGLNGGTANPTGASVNTKAGFSIVTYTATNNQNVSYSHGLNQAPEMIIIKDRDNTRNWGVYYTINGTNTNWMILNSDAVQGNNDSGVTPTGGSNNTYMYLHQDYFAPSYNSFANGGNDGSSKMIAYMWHSVSGYSKFGTYKGNSNANGTFVHVGFRPAWLMIKRTTGADAWVIYDNKRDSDNVMRNRLAPNTNANDAADDAIDFLSNGFKWRINSGLRNDSSHTYIFMAFAEQPGITPYDTQTNAR